MIQRRGGFSLTTKACQRLGIFGNVIRQELHRDKTMQGQVLGLIDHAHATIAKLLNNAVVRDRSTDHEKESAP